MLTYTNAFKALAIGALGTAIVMNTLSLLRSSKKIDKTSSFVPIIDITALRGYIVNEDGEEILVDETDPRLLEQTDIVTKKMYDACRNVGFFYITGHGVPEELVDLLDHASRLFFAESSECKDRINMTKGGSAWRGYFKVGDELTKGLPDIKEGIYFGTELSATDSRVKAGLPMHGSNLWPYTAEDGTMTSNDILIKEAVSAYMVHMQTLGHTLMSGIARSLQLPPDFFRNEFMSDPLCLFRIFNYPAPGPVADEYKREGVKGELWSVGEHTDYGMLTILRQDNSGGLQVRAVSDGEWMPAPPVHNAFVINIGDMLEKMTGGLYISTPHRVLNPLNKDRISFPFFFDPNFDASMISLVGKTPVLESVALRENNYKRWDGKPIGLADFHGTYGEYVLSKVAQVFPQLAQTQKIVQNDN